MVSEKSESKNNVMYLAVGSVILMVVIFAVLYFFVFSGDDGENGSLSGGSEIGITEKIKIKDLDIEIFQDQRFLKLKDSQTSLPSVSQLKPGKENPFKSE